MKTLDIVKARLKFVDETLKGPFMKSSQVNARNRSLIVVDKLYGGIDFPDTTASNKTRDLMLSSDQQMENVSSMCHHIKRSPLIVSSFKTTSILPSSIVLQLL